MSSASTVLPSAKVSTELSSAEVIRLPTGNRKRAATRTVGFTKTNVAKMRCASGEKEEFFWDASCRGFGMRALSSGRRSWIFQYRDEHKRTRRIALGDVSAVSLEAARAAARQHGSPGPLDHKCVSLRHVGNSHSAAKIVITFAVVSSTQ
jgi:hypothetical protein